MDIYIGNLPTSVESKDLQKVFKSALSPLNFRERVKNIIKRPHTFGRSCIKVKVKNTGLQDLHYAHAEIKPDFFARLAIERLSAFVCLGNNLIAREYVPRLSVSNRRTDKSRNLFAVTAYNRRINERRQLFAE